MSSVSSVVVFYNFDPNLLGLLSEGIKSDFSIDDCNYVLHLRYTTCPLATSDFFPVAVVSRESCQEDKTLNAWDAQDYADDLLGASPSKTVAGQARTGRSGDVPARTSDLEDEALSPSRSGEKRKAVEADREATEPTPAQELAKVCQNAVCSSIHVHFEPKVG